MARPKGELLTFDNAPQKGTFTVLQTLNHKNNKYGLYLDSKMFEKNLEQWNTTPVILAEKHPTKNKARENLNATLDEIKGKLLGYPTDVKLETAGTPRLTGNLPLSDPEAVKLHDAGRLATSPAYAAEDDGKSLTGDVTPDHILVFPSGPDAQPGAPSMMFGPDGKKSTSQEESHMTEEEVKKFQADAEKKDAELKAKEEELKSFQAKAESEKKALLEQKATVEAQLKAFQDKVIQEKADAEFKTFMAHVPKGWKEGKEKVKEGDKEIEVEKADLLRKEFQADPKALYERLLKFNETQQPGGTLAPGQGQEHTGDTAPENTSVGRWDAKKGDWANK